MPFFRILCLDSFYEAVHLICVFWLSNRIVVVESADDPLRKNRSDSDSKNVDAFQIGDETEINRSV
jgi:hypothetical protein